MIYFNKLIDICINRLKQNILNFMEYKVVIILNHKLSKSQRL